MVIDESKNGPMNPLSIVSCVNSMRNTHAFMLMTINRCIDYTKASKGLKLVPKHETIDLLETLELPLNCMRNMQHKIDIVLTSIPKEICTYIMTDKQWLQENVLCLLSNAVKYSAEGVVTINCFIEQYYSKGWKMHVINRDDGTHTGLNDDVDDDCSDEVIDSPYPPMQPFLRIEIEDTGIGMSEEAMASLFNPFKQTQRLAGGTGLGLYSLAKRLEALHGFYGVMKRRDDKQGSLFWFAIPYKPDTVYAQHMQASKMEDPIASTVTPQRPICPSTLGFQTVVPPPCDQTPPTVKGNHIKQVVSPAKLNEETLRILIVDDSPTILKMSYLMLNKLGHNVQTAENGAIAVKLVQEKLSQNDFFDVILMDLQMPVMDGLEATQRIRHLEKVSSEDSTMKQHSHSNEHVVEGLFPWRKRKNVIIGMSANSDHETSINALEVGMDAFLPKPFKVDAFRATFHKVIADVEM